MPHNREITADLKHWARGEGLYRNVYWGYIYNDTKGRWPDGCRIHTSVVTNIDEYNDCFIVTTLNSVYRLWKCDEAGVENETEGSSS